MQNYMFFGLKSPYKAISSIHFAQMALSAFAILAGLVASGSVFLNDLYFWVQSSHYINPYLCLMAFLLAFSPGAWGLAAIIILLPLSAGLGTQLNAYLGTHFLILPNSGLDLAAGFFLGLALREISKSSHFLGKNRHRDLTAALKELAPWPIALVIVMITISTAIAISRNVYQSAAATSFKGLLFNLVHFRPIGWHDDYMPISDWIAYALAVAMIVLVIGQLRDRENKNQIIFRPIMFGLIIAALMGVSQAITGVGLPENLLSFRTDRLGYAVIGFQPDLHAYAGHMLLGAVGLWGYFYSGISKFEKKIILCAVALSWICLILSKSRALLLFALVAMVVWLIVYLLRNKRRYLAPAALLGLFLFGAILFIVVNYSNSLGGIPILSWAGELAHQFKSRDLTSWSLFSGMFGARFEIWEGAIRMWSQFPLMGVGQGNFYRLSDIASFSRSNFLILNHGENAHNYFLQTLTETGVLGATIFLIALFAPLMGVRSKKLLIPAGIAILSLFLGNIFSHSFLVRENLLLACSIIGLMYVSSSVKPSEIESHHSNNITKNKHRVSSLVIWLLILIGILFGVQEVIRSFNKLPFEYGASCFIDLPQDSDGWTNGRYVFALPKETVNFKVTISNYLPGQKEPAQPLKVSLINGGGLRLSIDSIELRRENIIEATIYLTGKKQNISSLNTRALLELTNCSTPRNIGLSLDSRRLGLQITHSIANLL
jgi:O-antigen ligase